MEETRWGLSGYLSPDGIFYECEYEQHSKTASELKDKYQLEKEMDYNEIALRGEFLKFGTHPWSTKEGCGGCHVFKSPLHSLTDKQTSWLKQNLHKLTDKQRFELLISLEDVEREKIS